MKAWFNLKQLCAIWCNLVSLALKVRIGAAWCRLVRVWVGWCRLGEGWSKLV